MARYFWHPKTGKLKYYNTVAEIHRKHGDIPFFVSPEFAKAWQMERALGEAPEKFVGSTPTIGWKKKHVAKAVEPLKEYWATVQKYTDDLDIATYMHGVWKERLFQEVSARFNRETEDLAPPWEIRDSFKNYFKDLPELKDMVDDYEERWYGWEKTEEEKEPELPKGEFTVGYVSDSRSEAWIYSKLDYNATKRVFEDVAASFDPAQMEFETKTIEFDDKSKIPDPAVVFIKTNHGVYVYNIHGDRLEKSDYVSTDSYFDDDLFDEFIQNEPDIDSKRKTS